ncbi:MAG: PD-(D/E)XK nuclease family protein [Desulfovibrionaceae bacterium]|nr:PD-(D/E)XK nuclease family protein [Desulfovibrionaceae bacterium]
MRPIFLIPWHTDFMAALTDMVAASDAPADLTVLFPHNRPRRHLKGLLAAHPGVARPFRMPRMTSISDFVADLHRRLNPQTTALANPLDRVELLYQVAHDLRDRGDGLLARLPKLDREQFLPWGSKLASLMDDLMRQDLEAQDLKYMEGEVPPYAAALLEQLHDIHELYVARLEERGWTTPGLSARYVLGRLDAVAETLEGKTVLAAGFYALSGTEDKLFRFLWERGSLLPVIHSDPALAEDGHSHWAAAEHAAWLKRWRVQPELPDGIDTAPRQTAVRFCEGYDRHSQLAGLAGDLRACDSLDGTAVVLPDEGALLPVLHMLPAVDAELEPNISMGYPLNRTSLARLIETLLQLQENRSAKGRYYWKDVIALIRHPYLRLLGPEDRPLRPVFHQWEAAIRKGEKFLDPLAFEPNWDDPALQKVDGQAVMPLLKDILDCCLTRFESVDTLAGLADCLASLAALLHGQGEKLWHTYLIDAECLFRLTASVIPQLKDAEMSAQAFGRSTLHSFLRSMLAQERVSFEPDPISGLQVLGVLETRLLHFRRLFVLDAIEERLPGTNPYDPLLPDPLRSLLGLPDARERDNVSGYNFYRLLMGADEAVIFYQSGIQPGLLDSKSVRSRFVEQLLWQREARAGRVLKPEDGVVRAVTFPASSLPSGPPDIPVTEAMHAALVDKLTAKGLSPSSLDRYLTCPKQFFYSYLTRVRPVDMVDEEGDKSEFGTLVHAALKEFLLPHLGVEKELSKIDPEPLLAAFDESFRASSLFARLPLDTRLGLMETGRYRLKEFVRNQKTATLLALEEPFETRLEIEGLSIPFKGRIDRIERRGQDVYILDYKTGKRTVMPTKNFWQDMELRDRMETFGPDVVDPDLASDLARAVSSVQLPAYLRLYATAGQPAPANAGLIKLADGGKEQLLFPAKWTEDELAEAVDEVAPLLVESLVRHMVLATRFAPRTGAHCAWCAFTNPCGQTPPKTTYR